MEDTLIHAFDAAKALKSSAFGSRVQSSDDQHRLDIVAKDRTSALPWRGQFSPQLIEYMLDKHCRSGSTVLDPFCGSGTVLHEAARAGINSVGLDVNPAAVCLAKVSEVSLASMDERWLLTRSIRDFSEQLRTLGCESAGEISTDDSVKLLARTENSGLLQIALHGFLLFLFSNGKSVNEKKIGRGVERYISTLMSLPKFDGHVRAEVGDARSVREKDGVFDYLVRVRTH